MSLDPVVIDFVARGITDIGRAFDTIEKRVQRFESNATRSARLGSRDRIRSTDDEEQKRERAYRKLERECEQLEEKSKRAAERAETAKTRATERAAAERLRIQIRASEAAIRVTAREAEQEMRARQRVAAQVRSVGGRSMGRLATGGMAIAGAVGIGGGFMLADAMRERAAAGRNAGLLVNAVTGPGGIPAGASIGAILGQASQVSRETGMSIGDVTAGGLAYARGARGGDYEGVMKNMGFFAKMANVTGADINDIAGAAGTLQSQNASLGGANNAAMQQMLMAAYAQSKQGSVSMTEAAKQFGTLGSTRGLYQGDEATVQTKLLGLGQIAASGGERGDIGTYIKNLSLEAAAHRHRTKKTLGLEDDFGVKFDKYGRMESPEEMIAKVFKGTGGDLGKIHAIFGNRGMPMFTELQKSFIDAGGGDKGMAAVQKQIAGVTSATMTPQDLEKQNQQLLSDPAKKFELAVNRIKDTLIVSMEPALTRVAEKMQAAAPEIEKIVEKGGELAGWLAENPLKGAVALMGAVLAKDIAAAGIGAAVKAAIMAAFSGVSIPRVGGGVSRAASGFAGQAALVGAAGVLGGAVAAWDIDRNIDGMDASRRAAIGGSTQDVLAAAGLARSAQSGAVNPQRLAAARKRIVELQALASDKQQAIGQNPMGMAQTAVFAATGDLKQVREDQTNDQIQQYKQVKQALDAMIKSVQMADNVMRTAANSATAPGSPARNVPIPQRGVH